MHHLDAFAAGHRDRHDEVDAVGDLREIWRIQLGTRPQRRRRLLQVLHRLGPYKPSVSSDGCAARWPADDVHFVYLGDHDLAVDLQGAVAERAWLRDELFRRLPNLRFEVEDMIIEGGPWSTRIATRYAATRNGQVVYRGTNFGRVVWGKVVEERILPDTQALAAALA